jgi:hypothetical protein
MAALRSVSTAQGEGEGVAGTVGGSGVGDDGEDIAASLSAPGAVTKPRPGVVRRTTVGVA